MKVIILGSVILSILFACSVEKKDIFIPDNKQSIGDVLYKNAIVKKFKLYNKGEGNTSIELIKSSCGCTVPNWSDEIIKPNDFSTIYVVLDNDKLGKFNQVLLVYCKGKQIPDTIEIKGNVVYSKI